MFRGEPGAILRMMHSLRLSSPFPPFRRLLSTALMALVLLQSSLLAGVMPCDREPGSASPSAREVHPPASSTHRAPASCDHEEATSAPRRCYAMVQCSVAAIPLPDECVSLAPATASEAVLAAGATVLLAAPSFPPEPPPPRA